MLASSFYDTTDYYTTDAPVGQILSSAQALEQVKEKAYWAYRNYRPRFYPGKVKFITTSVKAFFPDDPAAVWRGLVDEIDVEVIPGDHLSIVTTHFEALAEVLTRYLEQASFEKPVPTVVGPRHPCR